MPVSPVSEFISRAPHDVSQPLVASGGPRLVEEELEDNGPGARALDSITTLADLSESLIKLFLELYIAQTSVPRASAISRASMPAATSNKHFEINQLTRYRIVPYATLRAGLTERLVPSHAYVQKTRAGQALLKQEARLLLTADQAQRTENQTLAAGAHG